MRSAVSKPPLWTPVGDPPRLPATNPALRVLAACAASRRFCPEFSLADPIAERLFERLGGDFRAFSASTLRCAAFRASVIDALSRRFFERAPRAVGLALGSCLGTRGHRLNGCNWVDIDSPFAAALRRQLLPQREGWTQVEADLREPDWVEAAFTEGARPCLVVLDESSLPLDGASMMRILDAASRRLVAGSELVIAFDAQAPLRPSSARGRSSAVELLAPESAAGERRVRYPRLRFVDDDGYSAELRTSFAAVNAVARVYGSVGAHSLAHLKLI